MKVIGKAIVEMAILTAVGLALGFGANAVRGSGSLQWNKAYFASPPPQTTAAQQPTGSKDSVADPKRSPKHPYQSITIDEIVDIVGDPDYDRGRFVVVDARNEKSFAEGHIHGATRCYHYELESCIDRLLEVALSAEKVIVYCNGGDCEDSKYMCRELIQRGVLERTVYLFDGGWEEWVKEEMPYVEGDE